MHSKTVARPPPARGLLDGTAEEGEGPGHLGNSGALYATESDKSMRSTVWPRLLLSCAFQYVSEEEKTRNLGAVRRRTRRIFLS